MIDVLDAFDAIGWDFDGTLIENENSPVLHAYIRNHPEKRHVILTFRTHGMQNRMFVEMRHLYHDAPGPECFSDIHNISDKAWWEADRCFQLRKAGQLRGPLTKWERYYIEWKGMMCADLGLPVLVDDNHPHTYTGCERYGIRYIHPNELSANRL